MKEITAETTASVLTLEEALSEIERLNKELAATQEARDKWRQHYEFAAHNANERRWIIEEIENIINNKYRNV